MPQHTKKETELCEWHDLSCNIGKLMNPTWYTTKLFLTMILGWCGGVFNEKCPKRLKQNFHDILLILYKIK